MQRSCSTYNRSAHNSTQRSCSTFNRALTSTLGIPGQTGAGAATIETVAAVSVEEAPRVSSGGAAASATGASRDACAGVQEKTVCAREGEEEAVEEAVVEEDVREGNDEVCVCVFVCVCV
jgi:hypothetical protein